MAKCKYS